MPFPDVSSAEIVHKCNCVSHFITFVHIITGGGWARSRHWRSAESVSPAGGGEPQTQVRVEKFPKLNILFVCIHNGYWPQTQGNTEEEAPGEVRRSPEPIQQQGAKGTGDFIILYYIILYKYKNINYIIIFIFYYIVRFYYLFQMHIC